MSTLNLVCDFRFRHGLLLDGALGKGVNWGHTRSWMSSDCWRLSGCAFQLDGEVKYELRWAELRSLQPGGGFIWLDVALWLKSEPPQTLRFGSRCGPPWQAPAHGQPRGLASVVVYP